MLLSLLAAMLLVATPAADQRIAERAVLKASDAPRGWTSHDDDSPPTRACRALTAAADRASGRARSPTFEPRGAFATRGVVYVYGDAAAAKRHLRAMSGDATMRCYGRFLERELTETVEREPLDVRRVGDERAGTRFTIGTELSADLVFVRVGRGLSLLFGIGERSPFDERHALIATQTRRLQSALSRRPPARRAGRAAGASGG
jgi:hypothetical protein